ncbi:MULTISPECIES: proteasome assembly chaperone family protein [Frigoribacterium]|uniref:proteasome assembly chaperone family protein n=1 Tax=Frigoribacterium TaxID=96492 RepID=UPI0006FAFE4B|nr:MULTISPECIES: PAC2 family protein [Frigoribacterium]KQM25073.1 carboxylate--amine ligase [Frigoribacterium sp. Leaf8]ROS56598.1 putative ATP-grasp superfamily ATP-dependent carboligase [Frigoribacterium sp. PhB118]WAC50033.1 PAC2 family protein [Frigoribacterium sp. SL97]VXB41087.1 Carboxylate--amine ligase [Frigoribacterium sp. 9N]
MTNTSDFAAGRLLVVAFEGWNDAGEAASGVARSLVETLSLEPVAELDGERYIDYQFNRPQVGLDDDGVRTLVWPRIQLHAAADAATVLPRDPSSPTTEVLVLLGAEPSRSWRGFAAEIVDLIDVHDVTGVVFLGAMLADVPHTRPISVFVSSENEAVRDEYTLERSTYEGPVGILSVLADAVEAAGVPTLSIWASVPHYVHNAPSPKATLALIEKLDELSGVTIPRGELAAESTAWESGIDALAADDEDMAGYIEQLEQARDTVDSPEASGEAIAQEFERYLRRRDGKGGDGRPDDPRYPPVP